MNNLLIFLLMASLLVAKPAIPLTYGEVEDYELSKKDDKFKKFFTFDPISNGKTIVFVKSVQGDCDPDIYISSKEEAPDSRKKSEVYCDSVGSDICLFDADKEKKYNIGVVSSSQCLVSILITLNKEDKIISQSNQTTIFTYFAESKDDFRVFHIQSPDKIDEFETLQIEINIYNIYWI